MLYSGHGAELEDCPASKFDQQNNASGRVTLNYSEPIKLRSINVPGAIIALIAALSLAVSISSNAATKNLPATKAEKVGMSSERMKRMTALGDRYIQNKV